MVQIKICGITTPADAILATEAGADMIGLNFYSRSPRFVSEAQAIDILAAIPQSLASVALFVNEPISHVERCSLALGMRTAQVHGEHTGIPTRVRVIPAFPVCDKSSLKRISGYIELLRSAHAADPP